jgi:hypothetical protein
MSASSDETSIRHSNGSSMIALCRDGIGWLMYLPGDDDAGFSSRNPEYAGAADATVSYTLSNGQVDEYPAQWALPINQVREALLHFLNTGQPATFVAWHNDGSEFPLFGAVA